jgi:hypothetical protein
MHAARLDRLQIDNLSAVAFRPDIETTVA